MCTVNRNVVKVPSMKADSCGAYDKRGNVKKHYFYLDNSCSVAHKDLNGGFYINVRAKVNSTWSKSIVNSEHVYGLTRRYRYNKSNSLTHMIAEVELSDGKPLDYYYVLYRWKEGSECDFQLSRHGNTSNPFQGKCDMETKKLLIKLMLFSLQARGKSPFVKENYNYFGVNSLVM